MHTVSRIVASREAAARGSQGLRAIGVRDDAINVLAPGMSERQIASVPPPTPRCVACHGVGAGAKPSLRSSRHSLHHLPRRGLNSAPAVRRASRR